MCFRNEGVVPGGPVLPEQVNRGLLIGKADPGMESSVFRLWPCETHVYCLWPACWGLSCIVLTECVIAGPSDTGQLLERLMCMCMCVCREEYHQIQSSPEILSEFRAIMDNFSEDWSYSSVTEYLLSL